MFIWIYLPSILLFQAGLQLNKMLIELQQALLLGLLLLLLQHQDVMDHESQQ